MCAYSTDLKERLARAVAHGQPMREAARRERDEEARTAWREAVAEHDPQQFVLVDESGTTHP